jgi:hypothetical protein
MNRSKLASPAATTEMTAADLLAPMLARPATLSTYRTRYTGHAIELFESLESTQPERAHAR